jgi:hypothetical protein
MLGEAESPELSEHPPGDGPSGLSGLLTDVQAHPTVLTVVALVALAAASALLHTAFVGLVHAPRVFMDELGYERMAQSFARTGHFSLFGKSGLAYSPLYPVVLAPVYALTSSLRVAYEWAKVENAVLLSLSVFPTYAIARFVLPRGRALAAATLCLIAPLMFYSGFEMSESLAYPLTLVAIWAMLRTVRDPSLRNDALLLLAIGLASTARLQQVVLVPTALTAVLLGAALRGDSRRDRGRDVLRAMSQHRLLFGATAFALVAVLARWAMNGGALPLAGRYANVGTAHASPLRVAELAVQHLAELDLAVGVVPFAAALFGGYALVRFGFPRKGVIFASVAIASTFWLVLEVAYDAAAFDATNAHPRRLSPLTDLPRMHERYLIYLIPLFLITLVASLPLLRSRLPMSRHLAVAVVAALLPLTIPFGDVINDTNGVDTFTLYPFGRTVAGRTVADPHVALIVLMLSVILALGYVCAAARRVPSLAVTVTGLVLVIVSALELGLQVKRVAPDAIGVPSQHDWVDRSVGSNRQVSLVAGTGVKVVALRETAFWNDSVARVFTTCDAVFGSDFGEQRLTGAIHTRYAVIPASWHAPGRILARDVPGKLVLLAPARGALTVPAGRASASRCAT